MGDDTITGGSYADTYKFNEGEGHDEITDNGPFSPNSDYQDKLVFGADIEPSEISYTRDGLDLVFSHINGTDSVRIKSWFVNKEHQLEQVVFANGDTLENA